MSKLKSFKWVTPIDLFQYLVNVLVEVEVFSPGHSLLLDSLIWWERVRILSIQAGSFHRSFFSSAMSSPEKEDGEG